MAKEKIQSHSDSIDLSRDLTLARDVVELAMNIFLTIGRLVHIVCHEMGAVFDPSFQCVE